MKTEKYVKLAAIEEMAKPMEDFHKGEESGSEEMGGHEGCKCPCCGAACASCSEEDSEEYEEEDSEEE
jgi:hypothetical protein